MVVDLGFVGNNRQAVRTAQIGKPRAVSLSGDTLRQHERAMEYRRELERVNEDLKASMLSLAAANTEIDRLTSLNRIQEEKINALIAELKAEQEKNARAQRQPRKQKKDKEQADPVDQEA